jgi:hypothetical protein
MSMTIQKTRERERNIWLRLIDTIENSRKRARNKGRRVIQRLFPLLK